MSAVRIIIKTIQLAITRVGAGWMFALLTFNFNRVAIGDLGAVAVIVTSLIGLHHFISFLYPYWGRISDRHPILGFRRSPYILLSGILASIPVLFLPSIAVGLGERSFVATIEAFFLIAFFGMAMAMNGSSSNALIAEIIPEKSRGGAVAVVWAAVIISGIGSSIVSQVMMPHYTPEAMQNLYNLTPFVVLGTMIIGLIGVEPRITKEQHAKLMAAQPAETDSPLGTLRVAARMMGENTQARNFFFYVLLGIMGIFLQDAILEPFGKQVFDMPQKQTAAFQQAWGAGALLGMFGIGMLSNFFPIAKKTIASIGGAGIALGLSVIAVASLTHQAALITPALLLMGLAIGFFNVGSLSMMMEMTIEGQAGLYMGMWGMAQGLGNGLANVVSGALVTVLMEQLGVSYSLGYAMIFGFEAMLMVAAIFILRGVSVQEFKGLSRRDVSTALAMDTAG
ncbi:PUCC protein [Oscillochloris trichoides DG-6]|uniref:PUCC protein n=1 Tax=Oscillochloris trichoides DG-6 TaxID=765420 RepID=E1IG95_9CHLR|nr:BCD family MFS transporter [Oscillochloris trichoides]EFO79829.1 PUCC protein [Oscillochloris trichoides DG-6]